MNVLIINGHEPYPFSPGTLNRHLVELARTTLEGLGHAVQVTETSKPYAVTAEIDRHLWADRIIVQSPVNWMGFAWSCKKYMDEVYTAGTDGRLCNGDGRSRSAPEQQYGSGGALHGRQYMLSLTFNAPAEAFGEGGQYLFGGKTVDDLFFPAHMNFRFFGMTPLQTFCCHDVVKNPRIEEDCERYRAHLARLFG